MTKEYTASVILKYSPRKTRLILNEIRGMRLDQAMTRLMSVNKGQSKKMFDLLKSAASNLSLTESDYSKYWIKTLTAEEAQKLYRSVPRARGSAFRIRRRYSRVKVTLTEGKHF